MTQLVEFLSRTRSCAPLLPGTHVCDVVSLSGILHNGIVNPERCSIFGEDLVYVFYGRPAFRPKTATQGACNYMSYPVCMVFDLEMLNCIPTRVYPFDTGAFESRKYDAILNSTFRRDDFALSPAIDSAARLVGAYFGSNGAYFRGEPRNDVSPDAPIHAEALGNLYKSYGTRNDSPYDDRCLTVELQYNQPLSARNAALLHIIAPTPYLQKKEIANFLTSGGTCDVYPTYLGTGAEAHSLVSLRCEEYLKRRSLI